MKSKLNKKKSDITYSNWAIFVVLAVAALVAAGCLGCRLRNAAGGAPANVQETSSPSEMYKPLAMSFEVSRINPAEHRARAQADESSESSAARSPALAVEPTIVFNDSLSNILASLRPTEVLWEIVPAPDENPHGHRLLYGEDSTRLTNSVPARPIPSPWTVLAAPTNMLVAIGPRPPSGQSLYWAAIAANAGHASDQFPTNAIQWPIISSPLYRYRLFGESPEGSWSRTVTNYGGFKRLEIIKLQ